MYGGSFEDLGEFAPDNGDPARIDPTALRDLKDPRDPAGPVPYEYQTHYGGNGNSPQGMAGMGQADWVSQTPWGEVGKAAGEVVQQAGQVMSATQALEHQQQIAKMQQTAAERGPRVSAPNFMPARNMSQKTMIWIGVGAAAAVGLAVWFVMRKKRR